MITKTLEQPITKVHASGIGWVAVALIDGTVCEAFVMAIRLVRCSTEATCAVCSNKRERERETIARHARIAHGLPTNVGTTRVTPTAATLVTISHWGRNLGCSTKGSFFPTILTPAVTLGQPITKLVGLSFPPPTKSKFP